MEWRQDAHRKPLVIRGARQVGKSTLVRMLGTSFDFFIELNAEKADVQDLSSNMYLLRSCSPFTRE